MFKKAKVWFVSMFITALWCCIITPPAHSIDGSLESQLLAYAGKTFVGCG
jgi:hypothetical protein